MNDCVAGGVFAIYFFPEIYFGFETERSRKMIMMQSVNFPVEAGLNRRLGNNGQYKR
jgi:hypothetical protein|tara:strand:+ start:285 stop:455 length:171 start_codon:yes stop_codon:yes gene_type:complete